MEKRNKHAYDVEYTRKNIILKHVQFNKNNPEDMELLKYLESQSVPVSPFLKSLIATAMEYKLNV